MLCNWINSRKHWLSHNGIQTIKITYVLQTSNNVHGFLTSDVNACNDIRFWCASPEMQSMKGKVKYEPVGIRILQTPAAALKIETIGSVDNRR